MITVTIYCYYPRKDGLTQKAVICKKCFSERGIFDAKKKAKERFERQYKRLGAPAAESYIVMTVSDYRHDKYYDSDEGWCFIKSDGTVHYDFY